MGFLRDLGKQLGLSVLESEPVFGPIQPNETLSVADVFRRAGDVIGNISNGALDIVETQLETFLAPDGSVTTGLRSVLSGRDLPRATTPNSLADAPAGPFATAISQVSPSLLIGGGVAAVAVTIALLARR